ncbi:hypothetical protein GRF61_17375 [Azoarcus sp. TTM-91]|uniref:hemerythrin domain-containing protein n=1 Tax=Azoarcus sp. TTM-91 TaxID=2691581 RepID=UPI00145E519B|nr:hemerythrin domain-containing protein [Azoarcus sp. TTM-91]NMG36221.1 hypothetical protein [Azoarcus sp. TTM-91]
MEHTRSPDALELLQAQHRDLRSLLAAAREKADTVAIGVSPDAPPRGDFALRETLPELRRRLIHYCRLESELFYPALGEACDDPAVGQARAEHEINCKLLEQAEGLVTVDQGVDGGEDRDGCYRDAFGKLADRLSQHLDQVEKVIFPLARKSRLDLAALGQRMGSLKAGSEEAPGASRAPDGRLDIGTGEDRNPDL